MKLKQKIRQVVVARNIIEKMGNAVKYQNPIGKKYLNKLAIDVMKLAKRNHRFLPYYLASRTF